jgi:hypothetical protein
MDKEWPVPPSSKQHQEKEMGGKEQRQEVSGERCVLKRSIVVKRLSIRGTPEEEEKESGAKQARKQQRTMRMCMQGRRMTIIAIYLPNPPLRSPPPSPLLPSAL